MEYRVVITGSADRDFREHFAWTQERSIQGAENWRSRIIAGIRSLKSNPESNALARESSAFPEPFRCLPIGKRRSAFRVLYHVSDDEVRILAIRRPAYDLMGADEWINELGAYRVSIMATGRPNCRRLRLWGSRRSVSHLDRRW